MSLKSMIAGACLLCASASTAAAQIPDRFPAVDAARAAQLVEGVVCGLNFTHRFARVVAETPGWRGYAIALCGPNRESLGPIIGWMQQGGRRVIVPANTGGQIFARPRDNDGFRLNGHAVITIFGVRHGDGVIGCALGRPNRHNPEPFAFTRCDPIEN